MNITGWKIVSTYTRAEAVKDGVQVAIPKEISSEAGIKFPVFITQKVYNKYVSVPKGMDYQNEDGRLWDILYMFSMKARKSNSALLLFDFVCHLPDNDDWTLFEKICERNRLLREVTLKAIVSPLDLDDPQPAITILLPDED
ncbi:MAG: hypothetical protein M0Q53_07390 [Prolixibacteraceae bacterium]|nr:hypothetical protein [Prolixibacteraceae bacterium]